MTAKPAKQAKPDGAPGDENARPLRFGRGFVILCITISFALFITLLALSYAFPAMTKIQNAPPPAEWTQKMERIGVCLIYYAAKHDKQLPPKLSTLYKEGYITELSQFDASDMPGKVEKEADIDSPNADFIYLLPSGRIGPQFQPALKQNLPDGQGRTLLLGEKGLSWDASPYEAAKPAPEEKTKQQANSAKPSEERP